MISNTKILRLIAGTLFCVLLVVSCGGDDDSKGPKATKMSLSANSAVIWKNLCKRITMNFTDDAGTLTPYGRLDALGITVVGATPYGTNTCTGDATTYVLGAPENKQSYFFIKTQDPGNVTITISGPLSATMKITAQAPEASLVLGQYNFEEYQANQGSASPTGSTMYNPLSISKCDSRLIVGDALNNRILVWNSRPTQNGQSADFAIGQPDLVTGSAGTTQAKMKLANSAVCVGGKLYVADFGNARILGFNNFPTSSGALADFVWGQPNFTTGTLPTTPSATNDITAKLTVFGTGLIASNPNWSRLIVWTTAPISGADAANMVLGQTGFGLQGNNTSVTGLNGPYATVWGNYLFVADTKNNRVLFFDATTLATYGSANLVLGQTTFDTATAGSTSTGLWSPASVDSDGDHIFVTDTQNSRVLIWNGIPTVNGAPADLAIGTAQGNPMLQGGGAATAQSGQYAQLLVDGPYLWISDYNHRVLQFPAP